MATEKELLTARIFLRAVFPVIRVMLEDDPKMGKKFEGVTAKVQFVAKDEAGDIGAHLVFDNGKFEVVQGMCEKPDITFSFKNVAKMNAMFAGKPVIPGIKGYKKTGLLIKVFGLLLGLKILMPNKWPKKYEKKKLKVKMVIYMVTTALSQFNKGGDPEMVKWTKKQPERIYQMSVENEDIAGYLRIKAGKSKSGRGMYTRRTPFVHMKFKGVDGALPILLSKVEFVEGVAKGYIVSEGSPEYAIHLNNFMKRIEAMIT